MVLEGILNRASLPSATRGRPRVSPAGVSLWLLSLGAADAQKGLPSVVQLLFCICCCCSVQGWGPGPLLGMSPGPEADLHPKARQTERYFALVLFFFGGYWILLPSK